MSLIALGALGMESGFSTSSRKALTFRSNSSSSSLFWSLFVFFSAFFS